MKYTLLFFVMLLTGCASTTVPVTQKFPEAPDTLKVKCPELDVIDKPTVLLSELVYTITKNYMKYHECSNVVDGWQDWHTKQKAISDSVSK
jgi:hypothetical protein